MFAYGGLLLYLLISCMLHEVEMQGYHEIFIEPNMKVNMNSDDAFAPLELQHCQMCASLSCPVYNVLRELCFLRQEQAVGITCAPGC